MDFIGECSQNYQGCAGIWLATTALSTTDWHGLLRPKRNTCSSGSRELLESVRGPCQIVTTAEMGDNARPQGQWFCGVASAEKQLRQ